MSAAVFAIMDALGTLDPLLADRTGLGKTGEAYLVNEEGKIVTQSRYLSHEETAKQRFETLGIVSALDQKEGVSIYRNYMGREVVGSYMWLPRYHSALLVEMEKDEILAPIRGIRIAVLYNGRPGEFDMHPGVFSVEQANLEAHQRDGQSLAQDGRRFP